jgi:PKD repeat protein
MKKLYTTIIFLLGMTAIGYAQCTITSSSVTPSGLTINVTATGTGATFPLYGWDWGDATTPSFNQTDSHTYASAGTYNVCAYYIDGSDTSCQDTDCQSVTVSAVGINEANGGVSTISASPNPFGAATTFNVSLAKNADVEISVYDVTGQKVETVKDEVMGAGNHAIVWTPASLADGVYFVQMVIDGQTTTKRIVHTSVN